MPSKLHFTSSLILDARWSGSCVDIVKQGNQLDSEAIRAMVAQALQSPHSEDAFDQLAQMAGIVCSELPEEMALINEVLDALPDDLANKLLINYFNDLYV